MKDEARQAGQAGCGCAEKFLYGTGHYVAPRLQPSWNQESELFWKTVSCSISASYSFGWMSPVERNVPPTEVNHTETTKTDTTTDQYLVHWDKPILSEEMLHRHAVMKPAAVTCSNRSPPQYQTVLYPDIIHFYWWLHQIYYIHLFRV